MKKFLLGIFVGISLFTSVGCNKSELTGSSTLSEEAKTWISASWAGRTVVFVDSLNNEKSFTFTPLLTDNQEDVQTYDCSKSFFGSTCYQYKTESIALAGKWVANDKTDSLTINYQLAQTNVPDDVTDIFTAQIANKSNQSADMIRVVNPPLNDSLQAQSFRKDSVIFGATTYKNVYYYAETEPLMTVYYTKVDGVIAFKYNGGTWYRKP